MKKVPDLTLVPISISYEKVIEAEMYSNELLGEQKKKESLNGLMRSSSLLNLNFGRINVIFGPPLSAKEFTENFVASKNSLQATVSEQITSPLPSLPSLTHKLLQPLEQQPISVSTVVSTSSTSSISSPVLTPYSIPSSVPSTLKTRTTLFNPFNDDEDRKELTQAFAYRISRELNKGLVVTSTSLVATVLLTYRKGITLDDFISNVDWLREDIGQNRGGFVAFEGTTPDLVNHALSLLSNIVTKVRNAYVPAAASSRAIDAGKQNKSILVLDYYRNHMIHFYARDGMIACALSGLANLTMPREGVRKRELVQEAFFLNQLLWLEFLNEPSQNTDLASDHL